MGLTEPVTSPVSRQLAVSVSLDVDAFGLSDKTLSMAELVCLPSLERPNSCVAGGGAPKSKTWTRSIVLSEFLRRSMTPSSWDRFRISSSGSKFWALARMAALFSAGLLSVIVRWVCFLLPFFFSVSPSASSKRVLVTAGDLGFFRGFGSSGTSNSARMSLLTISSLIPLFLAQDWMCRILAVAPLRTVQRSLQLTHLRTLERSSSVKSAVKRWAAGLTALDLRIGSGGPN